MQAEVRFLVGDPPTALEAAEEAVRIKELGVKLYKVEWAPEDASLYLTRGRIRLFLRGATLALEDFDRAIEISGGEAAAHAGRGDALRFAGRPDQATEAYRTALARDPDSKEAHLGLSRLFAKEFDDPDKALEHLEKYITLGGNPEVAGEILSNLSATDSDRRGSYAETIIVDEVDGKEYRLRIYQDGKRVRTPVK